MISQGLKMLKRAIGERPKGGMQTGIPKIQLREADALRAVAELEWAQQHITELEAQIPKWVSVEDELPDEGVDVLVFPIKMHLGDEPVYNAHLRNGSWIYIWAGAIYNVYPRVTHWMSLPPKDKDHE